MATAATDEGVRYRDKVTIVTGGANGIGRACVEMFGKCREFKFTTWMIQDALMHYFKRHRLNVLCT